MTVFNLETRKSIAHFPLPQGADVVKFDPGRRRAYAACLSGAIGVVQEDDPNHFRKIEDFSVQKLVHSLAVDPATHRVYAPEQQENGRPAARMIVYEAIKERSQAMDRTFAAMLFAWSGVLAGVSYSQTGDKFLKLEGSVPIPDVQGRIDHSAADVEGRRLFVAALGNNSLEILDLKNGTRVHSIRRLAEPQGVAYIPSAHRLFIANGRDGSVRSFDASSWAHLKTIEYGDDADNLRVDPATSHIWVGYGSGALAEFDVDGAKLAVIKLDAHPESFQIEKNDSRAFVNLPNRRRLASWIGRAAPTCRIDAQEARGPTTQWLSTSEMAACSS